MATGSRSHSAAAPLILAALMILLVPEASPGATGPTAPATPPDARQMLLDRAHRPGLPAFEKHHFERLARDVTRHAPPAKPGHAPSRASSPAPRPGTLSQDCYEWNTVVPSAFELSRSSHSMVFDSARNRMIMFGGYDNYYGWDESTYAYSFTGAPGWAWLSTTGSPGARSSVAMIYDSARDRVLLFGGFLTGGSLLSDVWSLSLSTYEWTQVVTAGADPTGVPNWGIYDTPRDRMVVGTNDGNSVWALSLAGTPTWTQLAVTDAPGPGFRGSPMAVFDAPRNRVVQFGGDSDNGLVNDVWAFSLTGTPAWTQILPTGTAPLPRFAGIAAFDAPRNRMLVYGGYADDGAGFTGDTNDLYALALSGSPKWTKINATDPPRPDEQMAGLYDPVGQRLVSYGGLNDGSDLWTVPLSGGGGSAAWARLSLGNPLDRWDYAAINDTPRQRLVMFGGQSSYTMEDDTWSLSLSGTPAWTLLTASGPRPPARSGQSAIFDAPHNRMIVFGGYSWDGLYLNDVWSLSLSGTPAWTKLNPSGTAPPARSYASVIYDPVRQRMVMFGGSGDDTYNDVWVLSMSGGGSWTQLAPAGAPPPPDWGMQGAYDSSRDCMTIDYYGTDVYRLSLAGTPTWSVIHPAPDPAWGAPGWYVDYSYNTSRDELVVISDYPEYWRLSLGASPAWTHLYVDGDTPSVQSTFPVLDDPAHSRKIFMSGYYTNQVVSIDELASGLELVTDASPALSGDVTRDPDRHCYDNGATVQLTASSPYGYAFTGWSGDASGADNPLTVTMSASRHITANFDAFTLNTSASPAGFGSVARLPDLPAYAPGSTVQITTTPSGGCRFVGWSGDVSGTTNPLTITMGANRTVVANFELIPPGCGAWSLVTAPGPSQRYGHAMAVDPVRHRVLVFGGISEGGVESELWALSLTTWTWTQLTPGGTSPFPCSPAGMVYDPVRDRMVMVATDIEYGNFGVWALSLGATPSWTALTTSSPLLQSPALIYDPPRDRLLLFGGYAEDGTGGNSPRVYQMPLGAPSPAWSLLATSGSMIGLTAPCAIYDPLRDRMLVFSGYGPAGFENRTWSLSLATNPPPWQALSPAGVWPPARYFATSSYDPVRDRMIVFGGYTAYHSLNDVWSLSLKHDPAWMELHPDGAPPPRNSTTLAYDADGDEMLAFGGIDNNTGVRYGDALRLVLGGGPALDVAASPSNRGSVSWTPLKMCYDPGETVTITATAGTGFFLGWGGDASGTTNPLTITMDGHRQIVANFDPGATATLLAQFEASGAASGIALRWRLGEGVTARAVSVERAEAAAGPWGALSLVMRDENGATIALDETAVAGREYWYRLRVTLGNGSSAALGLVSARAEEPILFSAITQVSPNPSGGRTMIRFAVARAGRVTLAVVDVAGRRVATLVDETRKPGRYTLTWDGGGRGGRLSAGVYFLKLATPDRNVNQRVVMVR